MLILANLCLFSLAVLARGETAGSRSCPGGYQHGAQFETGRYWYECKDGQVIPRGCLADNGQRVEVQDTFDTTENRMQCVLDSDGYLAILYKSCVMNGREHMVGDRWDDGTIWYTCKKDSSAVRTVAIGCVDENRPIAFDDRVARGDYVYQCKKSSSGRVEMARAGCARNGVKYGIGETFEYNSLWYTCTDSGPKVIGCIYNGQRLRDGDQYHENDMAFQCTVNGDKSGPTAAACLMRENGIETEKKFGCFWTEGDAPYEYEYTCTYNRERNTADKVQVRCSYKASEGVFRVEPGCYAKANGLAVGCVKDGSGQLSTKTFPADKIDSSYGLRAC